jgi:hypothetical protein
MALMGMGTSSRVVIFHMPAGAVPHANKIKASWSLLPLDDG